nr:hypothetical protein [Tanacetum cinerariifolium]
MAGEDTSQPPQPPITSSEVPRMVSSIKLPILKKGEYIKMEQYLAHTDYALWEVILNGNSAIQMTTDEAGNEIEVPPITVQQILARTKERKAKSTLLMAIPDEYLARFHGIKDAKTLWAAIKTRFGDVSTEDANQKFLRSLPSAWSNISLIMRNKPGLVNLDINDLYNNLKVYEADIKGSSRSSLNSQNMAFVSTESTNNTNELNAAYSVSTAIGHSSHPQEFNRKEPIGFDKTKVECYNCHRRGHFARDCRSVRNSRNRSRDIGNARYRGRDNGKRPAKEEDENALVVQDELGTYDWSYQVEEEPTDFALMAFTLNPSSSSSLNSKLVILLNMFNPVKSVKTPEQTKKSKHFSSGLKIDRKDWNGKMTQKLRMAKKSVLPTNVGKGTGHRERRPVWNNVQRIKHQNKFAPTAIFTRVNTAGLEVVSAVKGNEVTAVKTSAGCVWRPRVNDIDQLSKDNHWIYTCVDYGHPQQALKNKEIVNSGCFKHMTWNKAYLTDYKEINNGGFVAFGSSRGKNSGKCKNKTEKLDFDDVYFVNELKFNLFSVSQMCDKKNSVLFTETECLILSPNFKLLDESQVLLRVRRQSNMYSFDLQNIVPYQDLTCLFAKASIDESNLWHKRLGHVSSTKPPVRPSFLSSISQPLQMLHMDLFGPTSVMSLNHKKYCLVLTNDFSRFSWVFFLASKDETRKVLKPFITAIENQINKKVKVIRCDNRKKFKNRDLDEFCGMKGIKREYSNARTLQQNRVTKRKNRTLIEVARTMLLNSLLPITCWADYVLNRALVTKTHNKTPYKLLNGKTPRLDFMRPFVCPVTILNTLDPLGKFKGNQTDKNAGPQDTNGNTDNKATDDKPTDDTGLKTIEEPVTKEDQAYRDELDRLIINAASISGTFGAAGPSSPYPDAFIPANTLLHVDQDDS